MKTKKVLLAMMLVCTLGLVARAEIIRDTSFGLGADTFIGNDSNKGPNNNYGGGATIDIRNYPGVRAHIGYVKFDISGVSGSMSGSQLQIYITSGGSARTWDIYGLIDNDVDDAWGEMTITYNNAPGMLAATAGNFTIDAAKMTLLGTLAVPSTINVTVTSDPVTLDLTSFLESDTNGLVTFVLIPQPPERQFYVAAKEGVTAENGWIAPTLIMPNGSLGGAVDPVPDDDQSVNKDLLTELSWTLLEDIATCRVYFGTEPNLLTMDSILFNPAVESVTIDDFPNYSAPLAEGSYHWRVDCWDQPYIDPNSSDPNYFQGPFWSFDATSSPIFVSIAPAYQAKFVGETADAVTAVFTGSGTITYEWFKSDDDATDTLADDVSVGTGDTLSLETLALDDAGWYYCMADNGSPQTASPTVRISIKRQIIHYTFDGNVTDSSGNGLDGTLFGDEPNFVNDAIFGQALWFDGTSDYVQCPSDLDLALPAFNDFSLGMTITVWAKPDAAAGWARFVDIGNGPGVDNIFLTREGTTSNLIYNNNSGVVNAGGEIALNEWQMFAATVDEAGSVVLYANGLPVQTGTVGIPAITPRITNYIGESHYEGDAFYSGLMDDVQVWNYALTEDNIADMYAAGVGDYCRYPDIPGQFDYNGNCIVDLADFAEFAANWLNSGLCQNCQ